MALIVMSCSKDETTMSIPQESNAITFGTYVGRDAKTRATALNLTGLQTTGFGVFAYYTNGGDYTVGSTPNFMYNTKVSTASWTYAPIKYWPNESNDKLTFFAYAPHSTAPNSNITDLSANYATGDPTLIFTVNSTATAQSDLLYADTVATGLKNQTKQAIGGKVTFPFKHALSRIGFNVEVMSDQVNEDATGTDDDGTTVISDAIASVTVVSVQKVELIGKFAESNTFNFAAGTWATITPSTYVTYLLSSTNSNFEAVATAVPTTKTQLNKADSYLMIIPKAFTTTPTADPLKIKVTYTVTTADTELNGGSSAVINVIESDPFAFTFVAGKAYLFNLHLGLTSVKFDASMTDWDVTTPETVVNVPLNL